MTDQKNGKVYQRTYRSASAKSNYQTLSTYSVRHCIAICIYHKNSSLLIHWDEHTRLSELKLAVENYLKEFKIDGSSLNVSLVGGWRNMENKAVDAEHDRHRRNILGYFEELNCKINTEYFLKKTYLKEYESSHGNSHSKSRHKRISSTGYCVVSINIHTGTVHVDNSVQAYKEMSSVLSYHPDSDFYQINKIRLWQQRTHFEREHAIESGSRLINLDSYPKKSKAYAIDIADSAKSGQLERMKNLLHDGISHPDQAVDHSNTTALHHACVNNNFPCAKLLVANGASLDRKTTDGIRPLELKECKFDQTQCRQLRLLATIVNLSKETDPNQSYSTLAMFARGRLSLQEFPKYYNMVSTQFDGIEDEKILEQLETAAGLNLPARSKCTII